MKSIEDVTGLVSEEIVGILETVNKDPRYKWKDVVKTNLGEL